MHICTSSRACLTACSQPPAASFHSLPQHPLQVTTVGATSAQVYLSSGNLLPAYPLPTSQAWKITQLCTETITKMLTEVSVKGPTNGCTTCIGPTDTSAKQQHHQWHRARDKTACWEEGSAISHHLHVTVHAYSTLMESFRH